MLIKRKKFYGREFALHDVKRFFFRKRAAKKFCRIEIATLRVVDFNFTEHDPSVTLRTQFT